MKKLFAVAGALIIMIFLESGTLSETPSSAGNCATSPVAILHDTASPSFLLLSDIHLQDQGDQSPAITRNSDSGKDLWDSAQTKIRSVLSGKTGIPPPKFIIYLGDLPWHAKDSNKIQIANAMDNAGEVLKDLRGLAGQAHIPLLFVPGNNDSEEGDYGPFSATLFRRDKEGRKRWPAIDGAGDRSHTNNPLLQDTTALSLGCYSAYPLKNTHDLIVLVLNTNVFTSRYGKMTGKTRQVADAKKELKWLSNRLRAAAANHRQVLIAMHVPPGKDGYLKPDSSRQTCTGKFKDLWDPSLNAQNVFLDLVDTYQHSILGIVAGHTHMDGIRLLKNRKEDKASTMLISVAGIAPGHGNNPGFKIVNYDPADFQWNDFTTYYEDFFPDRSVKSWGDLSFSFNKVFHDTRSRNDGPENSMFDRLQHMPGDSLRKAVNSIYTLYNGDGFSKGNCVDTTLYVHYQP